MLSEEHIKHFSDFVRSVYPGLVSRMGTRLGDTAAGEDVVQEALVRAWERTRSGAAIESLPAWITTAALNLSRDRWRRQRTEQNALERLAASEPGLLEGIAATEPEVGPTALEQHVRELPLRQREVVLLHYFADLRVDEVAALLGVTEGTVKRCLFRARQRLQRALADPYATTGHRRARITRPTKLTKPTRRDAVKGWHMAGSHPKQYELGIAGDERLDGRRVAYLRCTAEQPDGFGTMMQMIASDRYRDTRIRFSGQVRTTNLAGDDWTGLWMRVDGPASGRSLAFDNMQTGKREIKGTTDWRRYEVVLDVATEATAIGFGVLLSGSGEVRVADLRFEEVGPDVPTTSAPRARPDRPQNLDLSED